MVTLRGLIVTERFGMLGTLACCDDFTAGGPVRQTVVDISKQCAPHATVVRPHHDAAFGAALLARDSWRSQEGKI